MENKKNKLETKVIVGIAVFSALAFVLSQVIRFPVMFLTFDVKDAIICISAFIYGPIAAPVVSLIAALLELITNISPVIGAHAGPGTIALFFVSNAR